MTKPWKIYWTGLNTTMEWLHTQLKPSDFSGEILSMSSFGREIKPFAPCRRFAAC
jgi:hypothetical protein